VSRADKRINVLVPRARKAQYQALADQLDVPLASLAVTLLSLGYDALLEQQERKASQAARRAAQAAQA
jgi:hypothetical protein